MREEREILKKAAAFLVPSLRRRPARSGERLRSSLNVRRPTQTVSRPLSCPGCLPQWLLAQWLLGLAQAPAVSARRQRKRPPSARAHAEAQLVAPIRAIHQASRGTSGVPRHVRRPAARPASRGSMRSWSQRGRGVGAVWAQAHCPSACTADARRWSSGRPSSSPVPHHAAPRSAIQRLLWQPTWFSPTWFSRPGSADLCGQRAQPPVDRRHHLRPDRGGRGFSLWR